VDVFTGTALMGNPLAVVMNTCGLTTEQMQSIAREFNLSETTFVERRGADVERAEGVRVRIFTTQDELPFAGHPTLGTASVLKMFAPDCLVGDTVMLAENVGPIPVRFTGEGLHAEMTQRDPEFGVELNRADVARLIGLNEEDLDPHLTPQVVSTGNAFAIVVLRGVEELGRLNVNPAKAMEWLGERGARWFYVLAPTGEREPAWRARMQFYGGEDPATGSAAGCAISYLVGRGAVAPGERIALCQGVEICRPGDMVLSAGIRNEGHGMKSAKVVDVRVAGSTILVAKGQLFLP
jgi:trans-2,3-dihydro-3-hydroxyanthranilate isomerase